MLQPHERLFFIHIPKTAGTTLIPLIDMHFDVREICPAQLWREFVRLRQEDLPGYRLFRGHFGGDGLNAFLPEKPVYMTMLRDPVALAVSTYKFIWREPGTRVHDLVRGGNMSLEEFLDNKKTRNKAADKQTRHLSFNLQHDPDTGPIFHHHESRAAVDQWVKDHKIRIAPEERLERAKQKLIDCRFFGFVERFDDSMALMCHAFGWRPIDRVQRLRVAPSASDEGGLSNALRERILRYNTLDTELYEFGKQLFEKRLAAMHADLARFSPEAPHHSNGAVPGVAETHRRLERHYEELCAASPTEKRECVRVNFDHAIAGTGWHRREGSALDGSTFRWTGPGRVSTLDLPVEADGDLTLTLCIINVLDETILEGFEVRVNDVPVDLQRIEHRAKGMVYQGVIDKAFLDPHRPFVRIAIEVPHTVQPRNVEPVCDDAREVGLAVNWIDVRSTENVEPGEVPAEAIDDREREHRRRQRRQAVMSGVKHRVAQIPVIGPRLRSAYIRLKHR